MTDTNAEDELIDQVVERVLRGEDAAGWIATRPGLAPATREKLQKLVLAFDPGTPVTRGAAGARRDELPFTTLGPYELRSRIGEGGMGVVYLAEHRFLQRRVALKIIRPELALAPGTRQRFHREAMNIARLRHENIVSVYDAGEHEGIAFLAMEWVEGAGLDELIAAARRAGRTVEVKSAVRHARDVARALQCAHDAGIVHRDVKPSNVRIAPDGRAQLLDFGLSLLEESTSRSSQGHFRGTPQYASPEQLELDRSDIDGRTDVYSLGITLYECLTGTVPFTATSMVQLLRQILEHEPPDARELVGDVDEVLNGIVKRAMARRREDRFASAGQLAHALDAWLDAPERPARAPRGRPWRLTASFAVLLLAVVGAAGWSLLHDSGGSNHAAGERARPVVWGAPRNPTPLFGVAGAAFDRRLDAWEPVLGPGTFGADEDGPGVIGICVEGLAGVPYALPPTEGRIRGRVDTIAPKPGQRTRSAGVGLEFSDGRIVALLLTSAADGYDLCVCELSGDAESRLVIGAELESHAGAADEGGSVAFALSWNPTDAQFDWRDAGSDGNSGSFLVPRPSGGVARPSRFLLVVNSGSARFEGVVLEEP